MTHPAEPDLLERFVDLSVSLTGFSAFELRSTGMAATYLETVLGEVGEETLDEILDHFLRAREAHGTEAELERQLRAELFGVPRLGAVVRNVIKLWYLGQWYALPDDPVDQPSPQRHLYLGRGMQAGRAVALASNQTRVVSGESYLQGLAWRAMLAHPMGGRQQGYSTWGEPPPGPPGG